MSTECNSLELKSYYNIYPLVLFSLNWVYCSSMKTFSINMVAYISFDFPKKLFAGHLIKLDQGKNCFMLQTSIE
ncbi:hypothetical protein BLOT_014625 [Blomia tropicalis]|nr:hypothetical protein BLOT_014625 [Blomia tropicalis]